MKIHSEAEAIEQIKKKYNFWGSETNHPYPSDKIHNAYFSGDPEILSEENIDERKVWKYRWPEEKDQVWWLLDDGQRITSEVDVRPTIEIQKSRPDFTLE